MGTFHPEIEVGNYFWVRWCGYVAQSELHSALEKYIKIGFHFLDIVVLYLYFMFYYKYHFVFMLFSLLFTYFLFLHVYILTTISSLFFYCIYVLLCVYIYIIIYYLIYYMLFTIYYAMWLCVYIYTYMCVYIYIYLLIYIYMYTVRCSDFSDRLQAGKTKVKWWLGLIPVEHRTSWCLLLLLSNQGRNRAVSQPPGLACLAFVLQSCISLLPCTQQDLFQQLLSQRTQLDDSFEDLHGRT